MSNTHLYNPSLQHELAVSVTGALIGTGLTRHVYESAIDDGIVIKIEDQNKDRFQNIFEWQVWDMVKGTPHARWFAPCVWISQSGGILMQRRTTMATKFPERMPAYLTDFKRYNYGMLKGRLVCHDYGSCLMLQEGMTNRMKKAEWWD